MLIVEPVEIMSKLGIGTPFIVDNGVSFYLNKERDSIYYINENILFICDINTLLLNVSNIHNMYDISKISHFLCIKDDNILKAPCLLNSDMTQKLTLSDVFIRSIKLTLLNL